MERTETQLLEHALVILRRVTFTSGRCMCGMLMAECDAEFHKPEDSGELERTSLIDEIESLKEPK